VLITVWCVRNVLLDLGLRAKVGDFGLTMDMEEEREEGGRPVIAIYWGAPEAIGKTYFNTHLES
jgi:hypothetical protein